MFHFQSVAIYYGIHKVIRWYFTARRYVSAVYAAVVLCMSASLSVCLSVCLCMCL